MKEHKCDRRVFVATTAATTALLTLPGRTLWRGRHRQARPLLVAQKNAGCMCCDRWAITLNERGIDTRIEVHPDLNAYKDEMQVPADLRSCHTGVVDGYVVEGHVPAEDILRLLETRPNVRGIAVAGMPLGSPGMEMGGRVDHYEVIAFGGPRGEYVFAEHG